MPVRIAFLTILAMLAFAGNSLLCRLALTRTGIDAASFTTLRIVAGALMLYLLVRLRSGTRATGSWASALALFAYAAGFSFAYLSLPAATGALLLFGAVQATMIGYGLGRGERLASSQACGLAIAAAGLVGLLLPGLSTPSLPGSLLMLGAGIAWGIYSLRGRAAGDPLSATAGNFLRATPFAAVLSLVLIGDASLDAAGLGYAAASGALASAGGYIVWYHALAGLRSTSAAAVQLSVPALAAVGGVILLGEPLTLRLLLASVAILGGVALAIAGRRMQRASG
jgi:drug/metabolite transporter (DMT)-like permease